MTCGRVNLYARVRIGGPLASGETGFGEINTSSDFDGFQFSGHPGVRVVIIAANSTPRLSKVGSAGGAGPADSTGSN